jgi:uncharacterized membrane protein
MKKLTVAIFNSKNEAERAITRLNDELDIDMSDVSYAYRNEDDGVEQGEGNMKQTTGDSAKKGAAIGGGIGALAGLATAIGVIPVIGPLFAAGPLAAALGLTGGVATTAAGAVTGAAAGGLIGALTNWGVSKEEAERYEEHVRTGNVLVAVHSDDPEAVEQMMEESGAREVNTSMVSSDEVPSRRY